MSSWFNLTRTTKLIAQRGQAGLLRQHIVQLGLMLLLASSVLAQAPHTAHQTTIQDTSSQHKQLGGKTTTPATGRNAFSLPATNMPLTRQLDFSVGNSFFRNPWVSAPATTDARDGLGPLFNTNGCQNCHIRDGRGHAPANDDDNAVSFLVRMSIPVGDEIVPEPHYGWQFQDFAIAGVEPEGKVKIHYTKKIIKFNDGDIVQLRQPRLELTELAYGKLHPKTQLSARIATPMIGLGLLEAIPAAAIKAQADPDDQNRDGISGRVNHVIDLATGKRAIGRFGWKAGQASVRAQNVAAFAGDLGITSQELPLESCTETQKACRQAPSGGDPELTTAVLDAVTFYASNLAVPAQRQGQSEAVQTGQQLFTSTGCASCHTPSWTTGEKPATAAWLANQTIYPYTDLLVHDMGEDLADHRPEGEANGREWRTPPLWGIGLTQTINPGSHFLHDGRARTLAEAILWHDGEAKASRQSFQKLAKSERDALLAFLNSL